ncbi:MAG: lipopolysaccharide biosynthesis protein [Nocardioides sp.]|uniref:lipopolysaccharide biosynthesis protein n=1 Tax=Nocardioides sp. TaxID=35761 RepID=UPI003D6B97B5
MTEADTGKPMPADNHRRDATSLAAASLVSGALAYVVFAIVTRALGAEGAGPVSVLWTWWGLSAAAITFPVQHWITRTVAAHGGFGVVRTSLLPLAVATVAAAMAVGAVTWLVRDQLFHSDGAAFPILVACLTIGSSLMGVVRGCLGARRRFRVLALTLLAENGTRCIGVGALWAAGVEDSAAYGAVIVAGLLTGLVWPGALDFPATGALAEGGRRAVLALLAGVSSGQLLGQVVLTGGPVILALLGGAPSTVTALFVALSVYRAPYIVAVGVVPQVTGRVTRLVVEGRHRELARLRQTLTAATLVLAAGAVAVGIWIGPPLIRAVFGSDVIVPATASALLAAGSVFAVANLVAAVLALAHGHSRIAALSWLCGMACASVVLVTGLSALGRIAAGFLLAEAVTFAVLLATGLRPAAGRRAP